MMSTPISSASASAARPETLGNSIILGRLMETATKISPASAADAPASATRKFDQSGITGAAIIGGIVAHLWANILYYPSAYLRKPSRRRHAILFFAAGIVAGIHVVECSGAVPWTCTTTSPVAIA